MHGELKRSRLKRRDSVVNWAITIISAIITLLLLVAADSRGISKKWVTAVMGTLGSFSLVIYAYRQRLLRWSLWVSLSICLAIHLVAIWIFFQYVLIDWQTFSIWLWLPVMVFEAFILLIAVKRIEEKLTSKRETIRASF